MSRPITTDEKILRTPNEPVSPDEVEDIIRELEESLRDTPLVGVGLAAPQIGINKRAAIVRIDTKDVKCSLNLINPVLVEKRDPFIHNAEGCLSIPNKQFNVNRYREIFVRDDLHPAGMIITDFEAVVAQHEIDHIENILVKDRTIGKNKIGRNDPCPCGRKKEDGKPIKFKNCHGR